MRISLYPVLLLLLIGASKIGFTQTLKENKKDEFTNSVVKRTSWEFLKRKMNDAYSFRISRIDQTTYFNLRMVFGYTKIFTIKKGDEIMLKLSNDEIVKIPNAESTISIFDSSMDSWKIETSYILDSSQIEKLKSNPVIRIRIYASDEYFEEDLKEKKSLIIRDALILVD